VIIVLIACVCPFNLTHILYICPSVCNAACFGE